MCLCQTLQVATRCLLEVAQMPCPRQFLQLCVCVCESVGEYVRVCESVSVAVLVEARISTSPASCAGQWSRCVWHVAQGLDESQLFLAVICSGLDQAMPHKFETRRIAASDKAEAAFR